MKNLSEKYIKFTYTKDYDVNLKNVPNRCVNYSNIPERFAK